MDAREYRVMREEEDSYWWYRALHERVLMHSRQILQAVDAPKILDAGCGTGGNLAKLHASFSDAALYGIDVHEDAVRMSKERNVATIEQASVEALPFEDRFFDLVISLDVLYFRGVNDKKAAREFFRVLKSGGSLLLNLPAFEWLRGRHDEAISTARRYTARSVRALVEPAGFRVRRLTYWNMPFFPFLVVWRPLSRKIFPKTAAVSDVARLPRALNELMAGVAMGEAHLTQHVSLPLGSSVFLWAQKP